MEESAAEAVGILASVRHSPSHHPLPPSSRSSPAVSPVLRVNHPSKPHLTAPTGRADAAHVDPSRTDKGRSVSQRTLIKEKLEEAFRANGFLIKTKQVSDGDATFCKFRQLRKYTRYYLKSWHKHLPDEVSKLYRGFLPPAPAQPPQQPPQPPPAS